MGEMPTIYESTFAKSNKTDAILVVEEKKLHVNKMLLSYHSDYFNTIFNSEFKEKSMKEIPIKDVNYKDFAAFLSLVQYNPIMPTEKNAENLLELAERFLLPCVKRRIEFFLLSTNMDRLEKVRIAEKYQLEDLLDQGINAMWQRKDFVEIMKTPFYKDISDRTKKKLFFRVLDVNR